MFAPQEAGIAWAAKSPALSRCQEKTRWDVFTWEETEVYCSKACIRTFLFIPRLTSIIEFALVLISFSSADLGDVKRLPYSPVWPQRFVTVYEVQRLREQQQSDQSQLQVRNAQSPRNIRLWSRASTQGFREMWLNLKDVFLFLQSRLLLHCERLRGQVCVHLEHVPRPQQVHLCTERPQWLLGRNQR